jgi:hypothetical protein
MELTAVMSDDSQSLFKKIDLLLIGRREIDFEKKLL